MEISLRRIKCIQELHKKYAEAMEFQLNALFDEISKTSSMDHGLQNGAENIQPRRELPRRTVIVDSNNTKATHSSTSRVTTNNNFKRPNVGSRLPRTRTNRIEFGQDNCQYGNTTSKKTRNFSMEPIGAKTVDKIPGLGPKAAEKLSAKNFCNALKLLGKFLECDKEEFIIFLQRDGGVLPHNAETAWKCLNDYRINHL